MNTEESNRIAKRLSSIRPSGLRKLFDLEHEIAKTSSSKILSFGLGNLNIPTMPQITSQLKGKIDDPIAHRYSSNAGLLELRESLSTKYKTRYNLDYNPEQIIITSGCLEALFDSFLAFINPGDEVLIQDPTFGYYSNQIILSGGTVKPIPLNPGFELTADNISEAITHKTKALILNFPSNPTGSVLNRKQIRDVVETAADNNLIVISDESYEDIVYEDHIHTCAAEIDYENVLVLSSFSKSYAMTGFRVGYVLGHPDLISSVSLVHQNNTACATTLSQIAAYFALQSPTSIQDPLIKELTERRSKTIKAFTTINGINLTNNPLGTFYIYPNVKETGMDGNEFSEFLLKNCQIVVVPGNEFGNTTNDYIRVSYGFLSQKEIEEASSRMKAYF
ncbi:MAG: pyridoxal phosphate-dependent aminotransferase [Candidatus Hodarchaeales archaeon]|jgi:aminotransferase